MTPRRLVLRVQVLAVIVGLATCPWLDDVRAAEDGKADVVLRHGKIYTADPARSFQQSIAQSIAFTGNSIVAVGDDDKVKLLIGPKTKVSDLGGKLVLPGLIDTHVHPIDGAIDGTKCSLAEVGGGKPPTIKALKPVIQDCLRKKPGGPDDWVEAVQLFNYGFKATAHDLDGIEKRRPIALDGNDGHTMWVNSRGLKLLKKKIDANPRGNNACGISSKPGLVADGVGLVEEKELSFRERVSLTAAVLKDMSANGITSLMDPRVGPDEEDVWLLLYRTGGIPMRVRMALYVDEFVDEPYRHIGETVKQLVNKSKEVNNGKEGDVDPNFLRAGMVKFFADDEMTCPTQTAALLRPYLDGHGKPSKNSGKLTLDPTQSDEKKQMRQFADLVTKLDAAGLGVHVHAIGDKAVRTSLDAFAAARKKNGDKHNRHSIAHLQLVDPHDFPRFKALGVIADMQLLWAKREPANEKPLEPYLGPDRYRYLYPAGSLLKAGAMIAGGSDWDVSSYNPFCAFQTAVTRRGGKGQEQEPLNSDEKIPLRAAVDAYTINAAFALKQDATTGSLEVGKRADLVVLDRDIFTIDPDKDPDAIADTKVLSTYLDGRLVYSAPANGTFSRMQRCDQIY
jgi:predicted amidohydrolase YtcJ